jgi:hypothetical protein
MSSRREQDARRREEAEEDVRRERESPHQYEREANASVEPHDIASSENFTGVDRAADAIEAFDAPLSSPR